MRQAQINVRTRACSRTSIARTKQAALTHNVRGKELRPPAGRQYCMPISQEPLNRSLPNCQQLLHLSNEGKVESFSSFASG